MRVLVFSWEYPPYLVGGMGQHVMKLLPALAALDPNLELHVLTPLFNGGRELETDGRLTIHRVRVEKPAAEDFFEGVCWANRNLALRAGELRQSLGGFDLLHLHDWLMSFAALEIQEAFGVPLLTTIHATERGRHRGYLYSGLQQAIDRAEQDVATRSREIITCSEAMCDEVQRFYGIPAGKIHVVPNGIDPSRFDRPKAEDLSEFRARYARPEERLVFNVGRLVYEKGADLLVEAAPQVLARIPEAKFVIGGRGPLLATLERRIQELNLRDKVLLAGYLSEEDRDRLYVAADCCVFPSRYEPFGIVALESMAAGTPVVVTAVGGLGTVVNHEYTGITVYPDNVESLAWGLIRVLGDPEATAIWADRAEKTVRQSLSWKVIADLTLAIYRQAVQSGQGERGRHQAVPA